MHRSPIVLSLLTACAAMASAGDTLAQLPQGYISTIAGGGNMGDGGPAIAAPLASIRGLAVDAAGNVYAADYDGGRVRRIDLNGAITTIAGNGALRSFGGDGGPATDATLYGPRVLALGPAESLYLLDFFRVRRIDLVTGVITTVAGGDVSHLPNLAGGGSHSMAIDTAGNLFVGMNHVVVRVDSGADGVVRGDAGETVTVVAGTLGAGNAVFGDGGPATAAGLGIAPMALRFDHVGNLFVCGDGRLRRIDAGADGLVAGTADEIITTVAGAGTQSPSNGTPLVMLQGVPDFGLAFDAAGHLFFGSLFRVSAGSDGLITGALDETLTSLQTVSQSSSGALEFDSQGRLLVAAAVATDPAFSKIARLSPGSSGLLSGDPGETLDVIAGNGLGLYGGDPIVATQATLKFPGTCAFDQAGHLYIADSWNYCIRRVDAVTGILTTVAGSGTEHFSPVHEGQPGLAVGMFPEYFAFDSAGHLFVRTQARIVRIDAGADGSVTGAADEVATTIAGMSISGTSFSGDGGPATLARLGHRFGSIRFDAAGGLVILDQPNFRVRRIDPGVDGRITGAADELIQTIVGNGIQGSTGDGGPATAATLDVLQSAPADLAFDSAKHLFIATASGLRRVDAATGIITTVAGQGFDSTGENIPATTAWLAPTSGIVFDAANNLFIAFDRIRRIAAGADGYLTGATDELVTSIAGTQNVVGFAGDGGAASGALFNFFFQSGSRLSLDTIGNLFLADFRNQRVRRIERIGTPADAPPVADAGDGFSVNEAQQDVLLDGSGSNDPDNDPLTYFWTQVAGPTVMLTGDSTASPTFDAPLVALGGATLTFQLTVTAHGESDTDTVSVTVVNVNHPPVADAGYDQSIAEGSPVTLHGETSFDIDFDTFTYAWVQVGGPVVPAVTLVAADTRNPTFTAPYYGTSGAPGVVATLVFQLTVADGFPQDAPAPGYGFANVVDTVTVEITNVNNDPSADAGSEQTVNENAAVALSGAASSDPDSDPLTYAWVQDGGPIVILDGATTAVPSFTAPFVGVGGADLTFELTVDDGYGGTHTDTVVVHVQNANDPPLAGAARPTVALLWPPNHRMVEIGITGVTDPNNNATIVITGVRQDEPTNGTGDGDTAIDAIINANGTVLLRAERAGNGNGRVYHIYFTASDLEGSSSGVVTVSVPHQKKTAAIDGGPLFNSTN